MEVLDDKNNSTNTISVQSNFRSSHKFLNFIESLDKKTFDFSNSYKSIYDDIKINKNSLSNDIPTLQELKENFSSFLHFK